MSRFRAHNPPREPDALRIEEQARRGRAAYENLVKRNIQIRRKNEKYDFVINTTSYWCDKCHEFFVSIDDLSFHLHSKHKMFVCRKCGKIQDEFGTYCIGCRELMDSGVAMRTIQRWPQHKIEEYKRLRSAILEILGRLFID